MDNIISLDEIQTIINKEKLSGKKIVLVGGVFDLLHFGHIKFLEEAAQLGDVLIIALEPDKRVQATKGLERPIHDEVKRAYILTSLRFVSYVTILPLLNTDQDYAGITKRLRPDIVAVTEGDPMLTNKKKQVEAIGGKIEVLPKIPTPSSTKLLKLLSIE